MVDAPQGLAEAKLVVSLERKYMLYLQWNNLEATGSGCCYILKGQSKAKGTRFV